MNYKFLEITEIKKSESSKTSVFEIVNKFGGKIIGHIYWNPIYRSYTFYPISFSSFEQNTLKDIILFLDDLKLGKVETQ